MRQRTPRSIIPLSLICIASTLLGQSPAVAAPQFAAGFVNCCFRIDATNADARGYNCNFKYSFSHSDFGERKVREHQGTFYVQPNWSGTVMLESATWVSPQLIGTVAYACN